VPTPALTDLVFDAGYRAKTERILRLRLEAFDWNCPQHITPRYTEGEVEKAVTPLRERLGQLESEKYRAACPARRRLGRKIMDATRPPLPPFSTGSATEKVRLAEDGWNSRNPEKVALAYIRDSQWHNRSEFVTGREAIVGFLTRKWQRELEYRLIKELWAFTGNRIAVRFAYEWHYDSGSWFRSYGNENWEFIRSSCHYSPRKFAFRRLELSRQLRSKSGDHIR